MENIEVRNSKEYIDAFANYIKTGDDHECRALASTNATSVTGYVPVPDFVEARIRTAWERNGILNLVKKTNLKGNVKVGFELSADGALVHNEGAAANNEEVITLGIVTMIPQSIKKWITITDEAIDLSSEEFINYIYDELVYRIAKKVESILIGLIADLDATASSTAVSANKITSAPAVGVVAQAIGAITGEAQGLHIAMNRATWALFKQAQYDGNFSVDPFEGLPVEFTDALPAYGSAEAGDVYAIVGDFYNGAQANFPAANEIVIKRDDLSLAEKDLVKFVGRQYVGLGVVGDKHFALLAKPSLTE